MASKNASRTQTYQYDKLDRLRHATYGTNVDDYSYDADGNRRTSLRLCKPLSSSPGQANGLHADRFVCDVRCRAAQAFGTLTPTQLSAGIRHKPWLNTYSR